MTRRQLLVAAATAFVLVTLTTWPIRSRHLIGWDAANFAFALDKIDIAAHRPHPPGYLGYVFAGRLLRPLFDDANAALTAWNVATKSAAAVLLMLITLSATGGSMAAAVAAAAILITSPLLWYYASNAEIYPTEMTLVLAVVYAGSETLRGKTRAVYWMAALLAATALFKVSAMILIGPAALFVWWHVEPADRWRSGLLFAGLSAAIAAVFFIIQPDFLQLLWGQFSGATAPSRLGGTTGNLGRTLNRNFRDTFVALAAAVGLVNSIGFAAWVVGDRRLPPLADRRLILLWAVPWLFLLLFIHIGNPGYVLPLLPVACLIIGSWCARQRTGAVVAFVLLQALVNIAHVVWLTPAPVTDVSYREKSFVQQMASDLEPLTFPTMAYVRQRDDAIDRLLSTASDCPAGSWVVVAEYDPVPVDWRRTSYYLPRATTVRLTPDGRPEHVGHGGDFTLVDGPQAISSPCGLLWMSAATEPVAGLPAGGRRIDGFGWVFPPGMGTASPSGVTWNVTTALQGAF